MPFATTLRSRFGLLAFFFIAATFFVAGCDQAGVASEEVAETAEEAKPDDAKLQFSPMPYGSGWEKPSSPPDAPVTQGRGGGASPYAYYLAARDEEDEEAPQGWWYHSIYLHFPEEMVSAADGATKQVTYRLNQRSNNAESRLANCYIPDTEDAQEALLEFLRSGGTEGDAGANSPVQMNAGGEATPGATPTKNGTCSRTYTMIVYVYET